MKPVQSLKPLLYPWRREFWIILSGTHDYRSRSHWLGQCVGGRMVIAIIAGVTSIAVVHSMGTAGVNPLARQTMLWILLSVNAFFCMFLSFGSGRNLERLHWKAVNCEFGDCYKIAVVPIESTEARFCAVAPELPGFIHYADNPIEALRGAQQAIDGWINREENEGRPVPPPTKAVI